MGCGILQQVGGGSNQLQGALSLANQLQKILLPKPSVRENMPKTAKNVNSGARTLLGTEAEIKAGVRSM